MDERMTKEGENANTLIASKQMAKKNANLTINELLMTNSKH